jgi:hypothetical protein
MEKNSQNTGSRKRTDVNGKRLTSLIAFSTFLVMTVTGLILYFVPEGRVAYWVDWKFLGLTKKGWGDLHIISSLVFAGAGAFHLYYNWKPLVNYLSGKFSGGLKLNRELAVTAVVTLIVVTGSIWPYPPFNYVIDLSAYLKGTWVRSSEYEPPFGHAEQVSLKILARKMDMDLDGALQELKSRGISFSSAEEKLEDIARANGLTPKDIYVIMKPFEIPEAPEQKGYDADLVEEKFSGTGLGNKKLEWVIGDTGIDPDVALRRLDGQGISIGPDDVFKKAAGRYGLEPIELLKVILVEGYQVERTAGK